MLELFVKPNCIFCRILENELIQREICYNKISIKHGIVPCLKYNGETVFIGLPNYDELSAFINAEGL